MTLIIYDLGSSSINSLSDIKLVSLTLQFQQTRDDLTSAESLIRSTKSGNSLMNTST